MAFLGILGPALVSVDYSFANPISLSPMSPENGNGGVLSSWKEISTYLKCGVRSCIRWEKERGMPVQRMAGPRSARVFAYREELDTWLEKQLKNGKEIDLELPARFRSAKRFLLWIVPLAALAALAALVFILVKGRSGPPPFQTGRYAIITTEPTGPGSAPRLGAYGVRRLPEHLGSFLFAI